MHNAKSSDYAFVVSMLHCTVLSLVSHQIYWWHDTPFDIFVKLEDSVVRQIQFDCRLLFCSGLCHKVCQASKQIITPVAIEHYSSPTTSYWYWQSYRIGENKLWGILLITWVYECLVNFIYFRGISLTFSEIIELSSYGNFLRKYYVINLNYFDLI